MYFSYLRVVFLISCLPLMALGQQFDISRIQKHVDYLASDELEGRGTATLGEIKPAGTERTFFQPFQLSMGVEGMTHQVMARNVIGLIDNGSKTTMVIGAHYDHLGKGMQGSSLSADSAHKIHNGADDNASGTSGLIELARYFSQNQVKENHNLLFIAFSAEELGLIGSKYFCSAPTIPLENMICMVNMDMIGRLDDAKGIVISGWGTSPSWGKYIPKIAEKNQLKITVDSSAVGASDHTSFYLKNIPATHFFTGSHGDYHKVTDDADKINAAGIGKVIEVIAEVLLKMDQDETLPVFAKAESQQGKSSASSFKVTLGVMPDYSFSGKGLKVDGVTKGRPADAAGMLSGDIITKLANKHIETIYDYMAILAEHEKGEQVEVWYLRGKTLLKKKLTF
jgi:hypothetical protein